MTIDRRSMGLPDPQTGLEDLLRAFYAAEMPAELRGSATGTSRPAARLAQGGRVSSGTRGGRRLGLTAMLTTLLLAASAFVLVPSAVPPADRSGGASADRSSGENRPERSPGPVELQGAHGGSVPASAAPADEADGEFPEFDIRILPIDADRR